MPNRYICDVLDAMRKCDQTRNYCPLIGLIEEAQILASRMESCLSDRNTIAWKEDEYRDLKRKIRSLEDKQHELEQENFEVEELILDKRKKHGIKKEDDKK